jgi:hypothetical protein
MKKDKPRKKKGRNEEKGRERMEGAGWGEREIKKEEGKSEGDSFQNPFVGRFPLRKSAL